MSGGWGAIVDGLSAADRTRLVTEAVAVLRGQLKDVDPSTLASRVQSALPGIANRMGLRVSQQELGEISKEIAAQLGGKGFLEPLLRQEANLTEIALTPLGHVWVLRKGAGSFELLDRFQPDLVEVWRAVEALLAPVGRAVSEASPSVDAKLPRSADLPGGARVKIIHPIIAPGKGYPSINIRLFEPRPVPPEQIVGWGVAPEQVVNELVRLVGQGLRILVIGGTASGKTTLLSALCHGIPKDARVVKAEDPEEIWLDHPHVVTLEARPAQVGSMVAPYTLADAVDDAMRMSPRWLIVGEMRRGDAVAALFRAQMSDHPGLSTFHAEGPEAAVARLNLMLYSDVGIRADAAKEMFAQAVDLVVQVGWSGGRRGMLGVWEVGKVLKAGNVQFRPVYQPSDNKLAPVEITRRV